MLTIAHWLPRFREAARAMTTLKERESWPRPRLEAFQLERINALWGHAVQHVAYYRDLARDRKLPARFATLDEFRQQVPVLPKQVLRERGTELLSEQRRPGVWKYTSGSTGRPTGAYWSLDAHREALAAKYRFYQSWGVDTFDRTVFLWGPGVVPKPGVKGLYMRYRQPVLDRLRNRLRLSALDLRPASLRDHLRRIEQFRPVMIYGYSRALYLLAAEAEAVGFSCPSIKVVVASAEPCWPHMVERIEKALKVRVAREYGSLECGVMATEGPDGLLRVREDHVLLETQPRDDGNHDVIATILNNPSFPLIRYAIGDMTDGPPRRHDHGFSVLNAIAGRSYDFLRARGGDLVHWVHIEQAIASQAQEVMRRFTLHQHRDGSVHVDVELDGRFTPESAAAQLAGFETYLREKLEGYPVITRIVDAVQQTAAGKHMVVRSDLYDANTAPAPAGPNGAAILSR